MQKEARIFGKNIGSILNENTRRDEEGEWTFTRRRDNTETDYVLGNEGRRERVRRLRIRNKVDLDYHPVEVEVEGKGSREERGESNKE